MLKFLNKFLFKEKDYKKSHYKQCSSISSQENKIYFKKLKIKNKELKTII